MVAGPGPSARYAHALSLVATRFLVAVGGNDGKQTLNDSWSLDTSEKPYRWQRIQDSGDVPPMRMYATAAARGDGLLLLTGGRDLTGTPLADAYGLARHRDGRWEWASAPGSMPSPRYQHGAVFVGPRLHILGGAVGGGRMVDAANAVVVLDTAAGKWVTRGRSSDGAGPAHGEEDVMRRCRHAMAAVGPYIFVHGGLKGSTLLDDLLLADDSSGTELSICDPRSAAWQQWMNAVHGAEAAAALITAAAEEAAAAALSMRRVNNMEDLRELDSNEMEEGAGGRTAGKVRWSRVGGGIRGGGGSAAALAQGRAGRGHEIAVVGSSEPAAVEGGVPASFWLRRRPWLPPGPCCVQPPRSDSPQSVTLAQRRRGEFPPTRDIPTPNVRLYHRAVVVAQDVSGQLRGLVRQLSIDQFENEGRRVSMGTSEAASVVSAGGLHRACV